MKSLISIIIPTYNEEASVEVLYKEILDAVNSLENNLYEIIFVDDGSTDNTFEKLKKLNFAKVLKFRKNFGQTSALDAGIKFAKGDFVVTMDADLQNDPKDISVLVKKMEETDFDVIAGWRKNRKDSFFKKFFSKCAASLRKYLIDDGIHDSGCTLKIYKRSCFDKINLAGEMHRFIPGILKIKGFKVGEIEVNHRQRRFGHTKYGFSRGLKGVLDMISVWFWKKYAHRPMHLFGSIGLFLIFVSFFAGVWAVYLKIFSGVDLSDNALTNLSMFGLMIGVQFFIFGLVADIISKNYFASTKDTIYDIEEIVEK